MSSSSDEHPDAGVNSGNDHDSNAVEPPSALRTISTHCNIGQQNVAAITATTIVLMNRHSGGYAIVYSFIHFCILQLYVYLLHINLIPGVRRRRE